MSDDVCLLLLPSPQLLSAQFCDCYHHFKCYLVQCDNIQENAGPSNNIEKLVGELFESQKKTANDILAIRNSQPGTERKLGEIILRIASLVDSLRKMSTSEQ